MAPPPTACGARVSGPRHIPATRQSRYCWTFDSRSAEAPVEALLHWAMPVSGGDGAGDVLVTIAPQEWSDNGGVIELLNVDGRKLVSITADEQTGRVVIARS